MKKILALLLTLALCLTAMAAMGEGVRVAMITDYGDITDQSFNQTTYEAAKAFCDAAGLEFTYYKPAGDSTAERVAMVEKAVDEDYNLIIMPGFAFGDTLAEVQDEYPETMFVALDVAEVPGSQPGPNVYCAVYQEELCGYMAGYAAVKLGYTKLGFLGGMAVPAVVRYGFGFVQGADAAAVELGNAADVSVDYVYGNQFFGDADITAYMDNWYQTMGVQVVFACGGGIFTSAAEAATKVEGAKVIGVDVDQSAQIDGNYGKPGLTLTSAMKGLGATVDTLIQATIDGNWANYGGKVDNLGLVGADPAANYVQLAPTTLFGEGFTAEDYQALVAKMFSGEITVSNAIDAMPMTTITVNDRGAVK